MSDISGESPLPVDFESAIKEVRALRNILYQERRRFVAQLEKLQHIQASHKGHVARLEQVISDYSTALALAKPEGT